MANKQSFEEYYSRLLFLYYKGKNADELICELRPFPICSSRGFPVGVDLSL